MMSSGRACAWVVVGVLAFGQLACTSVLPLDAADAERLLTALEAGDRLSVLDSQGVTTELVVTTIGADFIEGVGENDLPVRIAVAPMQEAEARRPAPGKTIGLAMGVAFLLFMQSVTMAGYEWY